MDRLLPKSSYEVIYFKLRTNFYTKKNIIRGMMMFKIPHKDFYNPYIAEIYAISKGGILALLYTVLW